MLITRSKIDVILEYLESSGGRKYCRENKHELADIFNLYDLDGRKKKTPHCFNAYFAANNIGFRIERKKDRRRILVELKCSRNPNYGTSYWEIVKLE